MTVVVDFLKVVPADVGRVGATGACVLALVRYVTAIDDGRQGREVIDGLVWWRVSHAGIAAALGGMSHDAIRRAVSKLENCSELVVFDPKDSADRSRYYRLPDESLRETASPPASHYAKSRRHNAESRQPLREIASCTIPIEELKEEEEVEKGARARGTRLPPGWTPPLTAVEQMRSRYPFVDFDHELEKFRDHWDAEAGSRASKRNWTAAWRNWIRRAVEFGYPQQRRRLSTADQRVRDIQALKAIPEPPLELEA